MRTYVLVVFAMIAAWGCREPAVSNEPPANLVREHQFLTAAQATKQVGESCFEAGASACLGEGAVCLHTRPGPDDKDGYICTMRCKQDCDCPADGWRCVNTIPSAPPEGNSFCQAPAGWTPQVATARVIVPTDRKVEVAP